MRKNKQSRKGIAAVELAVMLPVMVMLLFLLIEGANAMHAYSNLVEASREGARLALMEATPTEIENLVQGVIAELDIQALTTSVITDAGANTVTVEVAYDYQPFGKDAFEMLSGDNSLQLVAQTTMPLP